jgi:uncharacterized protein YbjT (DUF2867 family)
MEPILVTGGTGHLGRDLVRLLLAQRRPVRVLARSAGREPAVEWALGDLATGRGLAAAVRDVHTVIHAATLSPIAKRGGMRPVDFFTTPTTVDVDGTRRLLDECTRAGVAHFLHVSIVGLEDGSLPYARVKLAGEKLVRQSKLPWSIVRAMPFYYLVERVIAGLRWLPVWPVPDAPFNPVDTSDVAGYLAECLDDGKRGERDEIGGPEDLGVVEIARQYQRERRLHRRIVPLHLSPKAVRGMGFVVAQGRRGNVTWSSWLHSSSAA